MLTKTQATMCDTFHWNGNGGCHLTPKGSRGGGGHVKQSVVRRNGATQTWKTRPDEWRIPVKYGIRSRDQFSIHQYDAQKWHAPEDCPLNAKKEEV